MPPVSLAAPVPAGSSYVHPERSSLSRAASGAGAYWHLLSLDAPTVAALWAWMLGRVAGVSLPAHAPLLLALGTWLLYVGDRILDGLRCPDLGQLQRRHRFYARHRNAFVPVALCAAAFLSWCIVHAMPLRTQRDNLVLAAAAVTYFLAVHFPGRILRGASRWFPKELAVGLIFAAATAVPTWSRSPQAAGPLLVVVLLLAALAWLNCVAIETWERSTSSFHDPQQPHPSTRYLGAYFSVTAGALATAAVTAGAVALACGHAMAALACTAVMLSAVMLLLLHRRRQSLSPLSLRVCADAALLTPLLVLALVR